MAAAPPPKPWERNRGTSPAVGSSGIGTPSLPPAVGEGSVASNQDAVLSSAATAGNTALSRPVPARPWDRGGVASTSYSSSAYTANQPYGSSSYYGNRPGMYGGVGNSYMNQYGSMGSSYGSSYGVGGAYGSSYGVGGYNNYGRPGMHGSYAGSNMYGSPYSSMGGYGGGMYGGLPGPGGMFGGPGFDPNNPPAQPPTAWQHFLMAMNGALQFFSKICFLVDENTHAFHFFINALLQLLDRAGSLYGELARFVLRLLRLRRGRPGKELHPGHGHEAPGFPQQSGALVPHAGAQMKALSVPDNFAAPAAANWDGLWSN